MRDDVETLRSDIDVIRDRTPQRKGAKRKKVSFPEDIKARAAALWRQSGETSEAFAARIGVSASVVRRWRRDGDEVGFMPVAVRPAQGQAPAPTAPTVARGGALAVTWREVRLDLPQDIDARQLAELVTQLKGGASC